jgi:hypothetical protein
MMAGWTLVEWVPKGDAMTAKKNALSRWSAVVGLGGSILTLILLWILRSTPVSAQSGDLESAESKYPIIEGSRIDSCSFCHQGSPPALTQYGKDYLSHGRNSAAFTAIEALDSDGDGFTNIQEINALTFPGNPNDHPAVATSTRTPTATRTPTGGATQTAVPTATRTATVRPTARPGTLPFSVFIPVVSGQ